MTSERSSRRESYDGAQCPLPELPLIGWTHPRIAGELGLGPHRHPGAWELCWLRRGEVDWWVGEEAHTVPHGHCYLTRPDELHGGAHGMLQACDLYWLHLHVPASGFPGMPDLERRLLALPRVFRADRVTVGMWSDLLAEHREPAALAAQTAITAGLNRLLVAVLRSAQEHHSPKPSRAIAEAITFMQTRLDEPLPVAIVARAAGMSPSRFHDRFLNEIGEPPATWLRRLRLARAKQMLATGRPVTAVAHDLGFPSSQWFATVFRRHTGVAPSAWRPRFTAT